MSAKPNSDSSIIMKNLSLLFACALAPAMVANASNIAWVSYSPADDTPDPAAVGVGLVRAPDIGYTDLLKANGHDVTRIVTSSSPDVGLLNTFDLVIISRSVSSGHYQNGERSAAWNSVTAPTIELGGYPLRSSRMNYTDGTTMVDSTGPISLNVSNPSHPIFAGITLDGDNNVPYTVGLVNALALKEVNGKEIWTEVPQRGLSLNMNNVVGGGTVLATVATAEDPTFGGLVIGEWTAGSVMGNGDVLGGDRIVFLTGSREASGFTGGQASGIMDLTTEGQIMFLNAVDHLTVPEPSSLALIIPGLSLLVWRFRRK